MYACECQWWVFSKKFKNLKSFTVAQIYVKETIKHPPQTICPNKGGYGAIIVRWGQYKYDLVMLIMAKYQV